MKKRSLPLTLLLCVVSFGIYGLVWIFSISQELIDELKYHEIDKAELNILWLFLTLGLYYFWWNYKICSYLSEIERRKNMEPDFWAPLFSQSFGLILHQARINRIVIQ